MNPRPSKLVLNCVLFAAVFLAAASAHAQCTEITSGLRQPIGMALSSKGNLFVAESGSADLQSGRITIVDPSGNQRTLIDHMPSAPSDVGDPSGPTGIIMRGRKLYLAIGVGDVGIAGPRPGTTLENPNGPSSPIFSSILQIHVSDFVEKNTAGFNLTSDDQQALADGEVVTLSNGGRDKITLSLVTDFPNFIPFPLPDVPDNIQVANPFGLVVSGGFFYVTDGGRNLLWQVNPATGSQAEFVAFPDIPNPLFPNLGGPFLQAVPTGVAGFNGQVLVTLLRGAPFPTGSSTVELIDPQSGTDTQFIANLTTAIGILPLRPKGGPGFLVLEHSSFGPFFAGPGEVLRFDDPANPPVVLADCLSFPTSMVWNMKTGILYVSQLEGSVVTIPFQNDKP